MCLCERVSLVGAYLFFNEQLLNYAAVHATSSDEVKDEKGREGRERRRKFMAQCVSRWWGGKIRAWPFDEEEEEKAAQRARQQIITGSSTNHNGLVYKSSLAYRCTNTHLYQMKKLKGWC